MRLLNTLGLLRRKFRVWRETKKVDKQLVRLQLAQFSEPEIVLGQRELIWRISVPKHKDVFMTARDASDSDFIVYVHGLAFYRAWLACEITDYQACPVKQDMPKDSKFHWSSSHFAIGIENPVPLAEVGVNVISRQFTVCFTDGITRTLWLLSNEVEVFPVLVGDEESAVMLAEKVGISKPVRVIELKKRLAA